MDLLEDLFKHINSRRHHGLKGRLSARLFFNKKLLIVTAGLLVLLFIVGLMLILAMLPLLYELFNYINQEGLKGVFEWLTALLNRLWEGSGGKP